jgi:hypothetical protein
LSLLIFRYLEKKLDNKYTAYEIIDTLKSMDLILESEGYYSPVYTRTNLTDKLHEKYNFRTDYEVLSEKNLKKIFSSTKKIENVRKNGNKEKALKPFKNKE